jgi:hypothetical protein
MRGAMRKLYRQIDGVLHYHEAWAVDGGIVEHWGNVGQRGQLREHAIEIGISEEEQVNQILKPAVDIGYLPIDTDDHAVLCVKYAIDGFGSPADIRRLRKVEERLDNVLGWVGVGHCDGTSWGSGTMELFCIVVDPQIGQFVIEQELVNSGEDDVMEISVV